MNYKHLVRLTFCSCLFSLPFLLFSCASDCEEQVEETGTLRVQLAANSEVQTGVGTRVGETVEEVLPDVNDFSFSLLKGEMIRGEWNTFADYLADDEQVFRVGNDYCAKASYGTLTQEGFGLPCFAGSEPFVISKGETTDVQVTCYLANAKLSVAYTDAFKDFFASYSSEVVSSLGNKVKFEAGESRFAYFKPGNLTVRTTVKKKNGAVQPVTLEVKNVTAEPRHAYVLTLDVDAGNSTIEISFSDDPAGQKPITIEVSDEALSAPTPYFKANGFGTQPIEVTEGSLPETSEVYAFLNAYSGIAHCTLTTHSASLIAQGWPESVDLTSISAEQLQVMQRLGFSMAGLGEGRDKIAKVDFTNVIPNLMCEEGEEKSTHQFELTATDLLSKVNDTPLVLTVNCNNNHFNMSAESTVGYGTKKVEATLTLNGDPAKVTYWLKKEGMEQPIQPVSVRDNGDGTYQVTFRFADNQTVAPQIEARYYQRTVLLSFEMESPVVLSQQYEGDVWSKSATLQLTGSVDGWNFICTKNGTALADVKTVVTGTSVAVSSLPSNSKLLCQYVKTDGEGDVIGASNTLEIVTEEEKQVPNADFEEWSEPIWVWKGNLGVGSTDICTFNPYLPGSTDVCWSTRNDLTTQQAGGYSYYYVTYPGTVPVTSSWAAASKINYPATAISGSNSAEISTVGRGEGSTCTTGLLGNKMTCKIVTPGILFIGSYANGQENYGHAFSSRPVSMSFSYRLRSCNGESASAYISVEHREGEQTTVLGEGKVVLSGDVNSNEGERAMVNLEYGNVQLLPTHITIVFLSTDSSSPSYTPYFVAENFSGNRYSRGIGNVLVIDNVHLNYK